jgi:IS30 family transposase
MNYKRLSLEEREEISRGLWADESFADIARRLGRQTSTISREVHANVCYKKRSYHAVKAQAQSTAKRKQQAKPKKLGSNHQLRDYVYVKLQEEWSPEEIAKRIKLAYPTDMTMRISHETVYQHLYCLPRGALKKELMKALRQERKFRFNRKAVHAKRSTITDFLSISERPEEVKDRIVPGHWEGDLIMGSKASNSAMGTLVERTTRLTLLVPLEKKDAMSVREAFAKTFKRIPSIFKKTLTYDRGTEMAQHKLFTETTKIQVYFADPHSPWQRGTNENTNGLIRQYFPKGTNFKIVSLSAIRLAERRLNSRPRKALEYLTPSERFYELTTGQIIALGA